MALLLKTEMLTKENFKLNLYFEKVRRLYGERAEYIEVSMLIVILINYPNILIIILLRLIIISRICELSS